MIMIINFMIKEMPTRDHINQIDLNIITLISFSLIPIIILFFPSVLYGIPIVLNKKNNLNTSKNTSTKKTELKIISDGNNELIDLTLLIQKYLKTEKPFVDPKFCLDDLAKQLNIPKHHLYYCFNSIINKKFSEVRKEMRVEFAKELLINGDLENLSLEGIWTNVGFSSKTNFFISFKDVTGSTPIEFLKKRNSQLS